MENIYTKIIEIQNKRLKAALCTIVSSKGSTPLKSGAKMIVYESGKVFGSVGGGSIEKETVEYALELMENRKPKKYEFDLTGKNGMICGGTAEIYIEPLTFSDRLFVFGGGHVGKAIAKHSADLDFEITVVDDREGIFNDWENDSCKTVVSDFEEYIEAMYFDDSTYLVSVTYGHKKDSEVLLKCINKPFAYFGLMGSKRKVYEMKIMLEENGIKKDDIQKVNMPIGIEIKSESADEIAVSIVAELILVKNSRRAEK